VTTATPTTTQSETAALGRRFAAAFAGGGDLGAAESARLRRMAFGLFAVYMIVAVGIYLWRGIFFTPDKWALFLLVGAVLLGRAASFLRDWIPFVLLVFGYEYLRGIAGDIVVGHKAVWEVPRSAMPEVRVENLVHADEVLFFGHSPILLLQGWLYNRDVLHWWDFFALIMYSMHFVLPCVFAFVLWLTNKRRFWSFTLAFCFMTYVAFAFFLLYPAAPPWLAQTWGIMHGLGFPQNHVLEAIQPKGLGEIDTYAIWGNASPHPVAAMPSLHAGFPWLVMLFAVRYYGWKGLWFILYNVALWFAVLYTANHWYVDVLAGMAWATVSFFVVTGALAWLGASVRMPARLESAWRAARELPGRIGGLVRGSSSHA
jgi:hypothetical protein